MRTTILTLLAAGAIASADAQESPYFVTYDHHMEEPHYLELSITPLFATPKEGNRSAASTLELEYGTTGWWTTALYLDGQSTAHQSANFTGYRIENRFRLLMREHAVNPVFYVEFANINGADKVMREVVGFDSWRDLTEPVSEARLEKEREIETKLILSSDHRGWNFAGNLIAEKNLNASPWEYGYAVGATRPLAMAASPIECRLCRENFSAGIEMYGGLGEGHQVTLSGTSHYLAPTIAWSLPNAVTLRFSPAIGLTKDSNRTLVRFGISYELPIYR